MNYQAMCKVPLEPIMIRCVEPGGAFEKAGFKIKDILILPEIHTVNTFHKLLKKPKGDVVEFNAIPYAKFKPSCNPDERGSPEKRIVIAT